MRTQPLTAVLSLVAALSSASFAGPVVPPKEPAKVRVAVTSAAGGHGEFTLRLEPIPGVKINRYPKIKISVPEQPGLLAAAELSHGDERAPAPEKLATNYYETVPALSVRLEIAEDTATGRHELEGSVKYFYCMPASGFCAPHRETFKIPVSID